MLQTGHLDGPLRPAGRGVLIFVPKDSHSGSVPTAPTRRHFRNGHSGGCHGFSRGIGTNQAQARDCQSRVPAAGRTLPAPVPRIRQRKGGVRGHGEGAGVSKGHVSDRPTEALRYRTRNRAGRREWSARGRRHRTKGAGRRRVLESYFTSDWKTSGLRPARCKTRSNSRVQCWSAQETHTPQFRLHALVLFRKRLFTKKKHQQYRKNYFPDKFTKT